MPPSRSGIPPSPSRTSSRGPLSPTMSSPPASTHHLRPQLNRVGASACGGHHGTLALPMPAAALDMFAWGAKRPPAPAADAAARKRQRLGEERARPADEDEELTAFEEVAAGDMDALDVSPSQDFDGEVRLRGRSSGGGDSEEDEEDASEDFDNVIYAPPPARALVAPRHVGEMRKVTQVAANQHSPLPQEEEDDALSDGFEIDLQLESTLKRGSANDSQLVWRQRRSIKRDCTFVETENVLDVPQTTTNSPRPAGSTPRTSIKVIEIDDDVDSIESIEACSLSDRDPEPASLPTHSEPSRKSSGGYPTQSSTSLVVATRSLGFQPRLQKKRRKMEQQLTLDSFFRSRPCS